MHENFVTCNGYIPSYTGTKHINLNINVNIRWQNRVLMGMLPKARLKSSKLHNS
jgi:hypothetical protein